MNKFLSTCCLLIAVNFLCAQQFGGNPPSIHWNQINTDTARIIFPIGMDSTAQRVSNIVHWLARNNPAPLGHQLRKINIVLQTQTTIANGYVSLAPYRSEFNLTPELNNFDLGSIGWPEALAVHEFRHVQQYNNFRVGISKAAYYLFGDEGLLVANNAAVPDWFFEGDAVYNETITTNQGRGRLPFFLNEYKSLWLANKNYKWMKLRNGSLKDYVPNHYPLGYLMVNYGREKYGLDFWSKVTRDAAAYRGLFYPFQGAVKRYSGLDYKTFRKDAFDYYEKLSGVTGDKVIATQQEINQGTAAGIRSITPINTKYVTNYFFPYQLGGDSILYLKTSYRTRPAFYIRDVAGEHRLRTKDIALDEQFSYRNGKIVFAAFEPDARWAWKDFSVIKILDVYSHQQRTLSHRTKYFTPDISPDGNKIAAVEVLPGGKSQLLILDANSGKIIQQFHSIEISLFTDPKFIDDTSAVTAVRLADGEMALAIADINVGSLERLTTPSYGVLGFPSVNNGMVYFTASFSGNDELYALRLNDKKVFRITQTSLGNYFVTASAQKLVWSGFAAEGYQLQGMNSDEKTWTEVSEMEITAPTNPFPIAHSDELHDILSSEVPNRSFDISKYKQGGHLFRFHSWRPYYADPDFTYSIYSDNILNTMSTELFYHYNQDDKTNGVGVNLLYGAFYPYINGGMEYTFDLPVVINNKAAYINRLETKVGVSLPLDFTRGRTFKNLVIGTNYVYNQQIFKGIYKDSISNQNFSYLHHYLSWSQFIQQSTQHIYPRLGYSISLNHRYAISLYDSYQFIGSASIYLPGFFSTHNIILNGSFQQRDTINILFSNRFVNARGYNDYYLSRMWKLGVNYHFPIVYPDWGFANILYLQRIRGNAFYDFERVYSKNKLVTRDLRSVGGELYFDTRWWNEYPLTFGVRFSHLLDNELAGETKRNVFEILIPIVIPQ
ncbi:MAG: hypothetical protein E6H10_12655 [Bacteroidetes bacterium]|nr:MAG: hypothetical protein E6H10_12655 [Bacteroidota bacterium]